jgi:hypothetical protein
MVHGHLADPLNQQCPFLSKGSPCVEKSQFQANIGELQSLARQDIIQVILSNVFRKSDFETIFETNFVVFPDNGICSSFPSQKFLKGKTRKPCRIRIFNKRKNTGLGKTKEDHRETQAPGRHAHVLFFKSLRSRRPSSVSILAISRLMTSS